jgi:L-ascorbate metabolism protein UlaG (beta-lactamase superfamily)
VKKTGATLIVPIHWDHFGLPLDEAPRPLPYFMDDMSRSMPVLQQLAKADRVTIAFAPLISPFVCIGPK